MSFVCCRFQEQRATLAALQTRHLTSINWPRRSALNYPYVKILVSLGLVRSGWCAGWCAGRCAGCSRQFCGARGGARDGAGGGRSAGNRGDLRGTAGSFKTPFCLAYIRAKTRGRIRFPRIPAVPRGSPRFPADPRGSPRIPADPRGSPRIFADPRGSPRFPADPRGSPRIPALLRGQPAYFVINRLLSSGQL